MHTRCSPIAYCLPTQRFWPSSLMTVVKNARQRGSAGCCLPRPYGHTLAVGGRHNRIQCCSQRPCCCEGTLVGRTSCPLGDDSPGGGHRHQSIGISTHSTITVTRPFSVVVAALEDVTTHWYSSLAHSTLGKGTTQCHFSTGFPPQPPPPHHSSDAPARFVEVYENRTKDVGLLHYVLHATHNNGGHTHVVIQGTIPPDGVVFPPSITEGTTASTTTTTTTTCLENVDLGTTTIGVAVGQYAETERTFTMSDVERYGMLLGDWNPLHQSWSRIIDDEPDCDGAANLSLSSRRPPPHTPSSSSSSSPSPPPLSIRDHPLLRWLEDDNMDGCHQDETVGPPPPPPSSSSSNNNNHRNDTPTTPATTTTTSRLQHSRPIVHGMLVSGLFSCIFATLIPGTVYMSQQLQFVAPVHVNDKVTARVQVVAVRERKRPQQERQQQRSQREHHPGWIVTCDTTAQVVQASPRASTSTHGSPVVVEEEESAITTTTAATVECLRGQAKVFIPSGSIRPRILE